MRRTRRVLRDALLGLLRERDFGAITVRDLTTRAGVNRVTFYLHYRAKEELLVQTMREVLDELDAEARRNEGLWPKAPGLPPELLVRWFEHAAAHAEFYRLMFGRAGAGRFDTYLRRHVERLMTPVVEKHFRQEVSSAPLAIRSRFLASAYLGVLESWLEDMRHTPEEMAIWLWALTRPLLWQEDAGERR
ncbi:TetR-family transcriptional regulator [Cystobacter fuscus DSM 2262]|uniref:TetR-family transcriptional regulator n=1 Tax=Cystobacter fuscus (strain ATCC 25194 / DSM 2262 / NBRC 100088 / M29) TaxID=1242864 RepID=S9NVN5_CYSF2|nr:TetR/AcrR family transcriptional regulator [Cystobacter fuscus]EPX54981.1 TetR-family transcriptional regulator [Cystobacter fuscus DSM 2262]